MSEHTSGQVEDALYPGGSPPTANGLAKDTNVSPITPTPVKKSKRQAERTTKGAFAASLRKEEEEERLYQSKKAKSKKRPRPDSNTNNDVKDKPKESPSDGEPSRGDFLVVTPSPIQSTSDSTKASKVVTKTTTVASSDEKKPPEAPPSAEHPPGSQNGKHKRPRDRSSQTSSRQRRKLVYKAVSGTNQPIHKYALDMVSLVCNNSYCVINPKKSTPKTQSPKNDVPLTSGHNTKTEMTLKYPQEFHRVLDYPGRGFTQDSEPLKERLMRLQIRQRFASAASIGMSPIEFSRKLLKLWGGTLEQVYETPRESSVSGKKNNDCSSSLKKKSSKKRKIQSQSQTEDLASISKDGSKTKGAIASCDFEKCGGEVDPGSIHATAQLGSWSNANGHNGLIHRDPNHFNFQQSNNENTASEFNTHIFGESKERMERAKKLLQRRHRNNLKKTEQKVLTSTATPTSTSTSTSMLSTAMAVDPLAPAALVTSNENFDTERTPASKRKVVKRTPRKFTDDPSVPLLVKDLRLSHPEDEEHVNALHCFVRAKLLEVYVLKGEKVADPKNEESKDGKMMDEESPNLVGMRCAFCGHLPKNDRGKGQTMSVFFPKSIGEIYRGVCTWQRIHFPVCQFMPENYRMEYRIRKESDPTRGRKAHWVKSAYELGLRNIDENRNGLTYRPDSPYNIEEVLKIEVDPGGRSKAQRGGKNRPCSLSESKPKGQAAAPDDELELFGTDLEQSLEDSNGKQE